MFINNTMIRAILTGLSLIFISTSLTAEPIILTKRERDQLKKETIYAIDLIQRYHYKQTPFADIDSTELLAKYVDDLDGARLFLLKEDVDFILERFAGSLKPSYLYVGDLYPAFHLQCLFRAGKQSSGMDRKAPSGAIRF